MNSDAVFVFSDMLINSDMFIVGHLSKFLRNKKKTFQVTHLLLKNLVDIRT